MQLRIQDFLDEALTLKGVRQPVIQATLSRRLHEIEKKIGHSNRNRNILLMTGVTGPLVFLVA